MLPPVSIEPEPLMNLWFQVQHSPFWTNLTSDCKTATLGSLDSHALLILTYTSKSKNQVVHEQKFKDLLSSTCQDWTWNLRSKGFNTHWGNILLLECSVFML